MADLDVSPAEAIAVVRDAFLALGRAEFDLPQRLSLEGGRALIMPVHHRPSGETVVKCLTIDLDRRPAIVGTVLWLSPDGRRLVLDAEELTQLRTGAVVGLATDLLAAPTADSLCLIGVGAQARHQVLAVDAVRPLTRLVVVGRDPVRAERFTARMRDDLPRLADITVERSADDAVSGVAVVCCATSSRTPLFRAESLQPGTHVNAIGAHRPDMAELGPDVFAAAGRVVVDQLDAALDEAGDLITGIRVGALAPDRIEGLAAALLAPPRRDGRTTVFKSVGLAIQDWALASLVARRGAPAR